MFHGEVSPACYAGADKSFYHSSLATLRNAIVLRTGGVKARVGSTYLNSTKSDGAARLVPLDFGGSSGYFLEFGNLYVRFWLGSTRLTPGTTEAWSVSSVAYVQGEFVSNGGNIYICLVDHTSASTSEPGVGATWQTYWYLQGAAASAVIELPTAYTTAQVPYLKFAYQLNAMTIVHPSHDPRQLQRVANPNAASEWTWTINDIDFAGADVVPDNLAVSGSSGTGWGYSIAVIGSNGVSTVYGPLATAVRTNESATSLAGLQVSLAASPRTITWSAVSDGDMVTRYGSGFAVTGYRLYLTESADSFPSLVRSLNVGNVTSYVDNGGSWPSFLEVGNEAADIDLTGTDNRPAAVGAYQQRMLFAGSNAQPDVTHASVSGVPTDFSVSDPLVDSDALSYRRVGQSVMRVIDFVEVAERLVEFSDRAEGIIQGDVNGILRPGEVNPRSVSQNGIASYPGPLVVNDTALYVQAQGSIVRDLVPTDRQGFSGSDLTLLSAHLVDGYTIVAWCYQQTPHSIVWAVRSDGALLSLTYVREAGIVGWAKHDTDGTYESIVSVRDSVYAIVNRTINSQTKRYIEVFNNWANTGTSLIQMDCAKSYSIPGSVTLTGLSHLEGESVSVYADGVCIASPNNPAYTTITVASGQITVPAIYTAVTVGLPFVVDVQTLDLEHATTSRLDSAINVTRLGLWLVASAAPFAAAKAPTSSTAVTSMEQMRFVDDDGNTTTSPVTGYREVMVAGMFTRGGRIFIRHVDPTPLTIAAINIQGTFGR